MVRKSYTILSFYNKQTWTKKSSSMFVDTNVESLEPIQLDTIGASSAAPFSQIETTIEKVLYPLYRLFYHRLIQSS